MPYKSAAKVTLISPNILVRGIAFLFRSKNHIYIYIYISTEVLKLSRSEVSII